MAAPNPAQMVDALEDRLRPFGNQMAILDRDLAPLLGLTLPRMRAAITRNLNQIPPGQAFHPEEVHGAVWALTELGALLVSAHVRTPEAAALSIQVIRALNEF